MSKNRISQSLPDCMFVIVKRPDGWRPRNYYEIPNNAEVLLKTPVASYEEAHDDLQRCNRLSMQNQLGTWAIVELVNAES